MDEITNQFRAKAEIQLRRAAGLPEDYEPVRTLPEKPTFRGEDLPGGMPTAGSLPFFPNEPGIHPDHVSKKTEDYYSRYQNSAPETIEKMLLEKEEVFCQHYAVTRNGAASARAAGYPAKTARANAYKLLMKNTIRQRITHLLQFNYYNDQATPAHAMALVMSALQGGPEPTLRIRAARTILDIYKAAGGQPVDGQLESLLPATQEKNLPECQPIEANLLTNNTFIQINGQPMSTDVNQMSTDVNQNRVECQPDVNSLSTDVTQDQSKKSPLSNNERGPISESVLSF